MTLFNSANPRIAAKQATVLETLAAIPDEYGAVFVIDQYQAELTLAVRAHVEAQRMSRVREHARTLNRRGRRRRAVVVLDDWRAA